MKSNLDIKLSFKLMNDVPVAGRDGQLHVLACAMAFPDDNVFVIIKNVYGTKR